MMSRPRIIVIGCGGAGNNTINRLHQMGISGAETIAINTDKQHLDIIQADKRVLIGKSLTRGLGAGGYPDVGKKAAEMARPTLEKTLKGADLIFVTAGMGGGTGTGSAPVVAQIAKEQGAVVVGVVSYPFQVEKARLIRAEEGLDALTANADSVIVLDNNKLKQFVPNLPLGQAFSVMDQLISETIKSISESITEPSLHNLEYSAVRELMRKGGVGVMLIGESKEPERIQSVVKNCLDNRMLDVDYHDASGALIQVTGGSELTALEAREIAASLTSGLNPDADVIWGARVANGMEGKVRVMAIMTGVQTGKMIGSRDSYKVIIEDLEQKKMNPKHPQLPKNGKIRDCRLLEWDSGDSPDRETGVIFQPDGNISPTMKKAHEFRKSSNQEYPNHKTNMKVENSIINESPFVATEKQVPNLFSDVHFSITCPKKVAVGSLFFLDVWAHLNHQREEVITRALQGYIDADISIRSQGPFEIREKARISIYLDIQNLNVNNPENIIFWRGQIANVNYLVRVPDTAPFGNTIGRVKILVDGFQIASIYFELTITEGSSQKEVIESKIQYYHKAFLSYSRKDLNRILPRIQTLQKVAPHLEIKMDIKDLKSGERWKDKLREYVSMSDIFYLFWSVNASKSEWVEKEWKCAYRLKGIDFIDPFPLDSPDDAPPPPELADKHFDEWILAFTRLNSM